MKYSQDIAVLEANAAQSLLELDGLSSTQVFMGEEASVTCRVVFGNEEKEVLLPRGSTLLEACSRAGFELDAVCGGEGKCGRCKVRPTGRFNSNASALVTDEERADGITLACQSFVDGDVSIEVLPRSRIGKHQILTKSVERGMGPVSPWVSKRYLELPPPTLSDSIADYERLLRGMDRKELCIPLDTLKGLPGVLRAAGWKVTATLTELEGTNEITRIEAGDTSRKLLGIAVDIGTTTVVVDLVDLATGETLGTTSDYNHQTSRGEDVIARMMFAEERGPSELKHLARDTINRLVDDLVKGLSAKSGSKTSQGDIVAASIAANTVMIQLFMGIDTRSVRFEPYVPASYRMPCMKAAELGLAVNPSSRVMIFPARAGYVGGDVVADVLASGIHRSSKMAMLIDVGTNGEIVLGNRDWMVSCACSAGPAFEGGEVSSGMRAMEGAIDKIRINDDLTTTYHVIGDVEPSGICGSGLIDLLAEMHTKGIIDRKARIQVSENEGIRVTDSGASFVVEKRQNMGPYARGDLVVSDADLQNLLRTKAAIYGACSVLVKKTEVSFEELSSVVVAGGFGYHLDIGRAVSIGMFPDLPADRYRFIGNGSLGGARLALVSAKERKEAFEIFDKMTYIELSTDNEFYNEFSSSLFIPHTDLSRFPTDQAADHEVRP